MCRSYPSSFFSRDSLIPYRTATQCPSPPYSFGARSKLATRCRCIIVLSSRVSHPHAQRLLTTIFIGFCGDYLARPFACPPLPWFSWEPRHILPHRGQAGPHLSYDLSFRRIYRPHRRPDRYEDPPMVVPWHVHPGALHYGRRDLALEERARQPRLGPLRASVDQRAHVCMFGFDEREHGLAGYHG